MSVSHEYESTMTQVALCAGMMADGSLGVHKENVLKGFVGLVILTP